MAKKANTANTAPSRKPFSAALTFIPALILVTLILGFVLRTVFLEDIEYKGDEAAMFAKTQSVGHSEPWPMLGIVSGVGVSNPAFSIWSFVALAKVFQITTPLGLTRAVQLLNCAALALLFFLGFRVVEQKEKKAWLWAAALMSVNVFCVLFSRKIWAQDLLPIFTIPFYWAWLKRSKARGAFFWGMLGAFLGQIHMSGFFFSGAIFIWTAVFDRKTPHWLSWLGGSILGVLPLLPWLSYMLNEAPSQARTGTNNPMDLVFYKNWFSDTFGLGTDYSLWNQNADFLSGPVIHGETTYLVSYLQSILFYAGVAILIVGTFRFIVKLGKAKPGVFKSLQNLISNPKNEGAFLISATLIFMGIPLTFVDFPIYRHYLIITYPLSFLFLAKMVLSHFKKADAILAAILIAELAISIGFLGYIHVNCGAPSGDYGKAYRCRPH